MGGTCCTLAQRGRAHLGSAAVLLNLAVALAGPAMVVGAVFVKFWVERRIQVVLGEHSGALPFFLMAVGCLLFCIQIAAVKVTNDCRCAEGMRRRNSRLLVFVQGLQALTLLLMLVGAIMCLVHKNIIKDNLHSGIMAAMRLYRDDHKVKVAVDGIQTSFRCCGSHTLSDWFKVSWIPLSTVNVDHPDVVRYLVEGELIKDDAPFSCCDVTAPRPCVHHDVLNLSAHRGLGPAGTLYPVGCVEALEDYWQESVLKPADEILFITMTIQTVCVVLARLLQTSLDEALDRGDGTGEGEAYCCRQCPCALVPTKDPSKVLQKKEDDKKAAESGDTSSEVSGDETEDEEDTEAEDKGKDGGGGGGGGGDADKQPKKKKDKKKNKKKKDKDKKKKKKKEKTKKGKSKPKKAKPKKPKMKGKTGGKKKGGGGKKKK